VIKKVWVYLIRVGTPDIELLVFDHVDVDAGVQIPAGTVEPNEDLATAVQRELMEEAGIAVESFTALEVFEREWDGQLVQAHLFAAWAPPNVRKEWIHHVKGKGEDDGILFRCYWLPRAEWNKVYGDFNLGYPALNQFITNSRLNEKL